jgi:VWFA-related protein
MRSSRVGLVGLCVMSSLAGLAGQQESRPQFRTGVELVQLDVTVLDNQRRPVTGLSASDFIVLDDGAETPIRAFTPVELARPLAAPPVWAGDTSLDAVTNQATKEDGRLLVILLDRSIPPEQPTITARKIATNAVQSLGTNDLAAVLSTRHGAVQGLAVQNLTADRPRLLRAINAIKPSSGISAEAEAIWNQAPGFKIEPANEPSCLCGLCVHEAITRVAEAVSSAQRRKKVLLFIGSDMIWQTYRTPGHAYQDTGCEKPLEDARTTMFAAVDRANLTVHSIDPQGLENAAPMAHASQSTLANRSRSASLDAVWGSTAHPMSGRQNLSVLPDRTGGRVVAGRNSLEEVIPQILDESSAYYVIGIERGASARPDGMRRLEIKVRRKGAHVAAQRLYLGLSARPNASTDVPTATKAAPLENALTSLLPRDEVPLSLTVTPFANPESGTPIVRFNIDVSAFVRSDGAPVPLDIAILPVDSAGRQVASARQTSTVTARRPESDPRFTLDVQSLLPLPPGEFGIRVAVSDPGAGKVGSVFSDITVPNYAETPLTLSGVSVESGGTANGDPVATTRRRFARTEQVRAVLQMYQGTTQTEPPASVSMRVRILDARGVAVHDQPLTYPAATFPRRRAGCVFVLPLSSLAAGEYLVSFDASANGRTSGRTLRFRVE